MRFLISGLILLLTNTCLFSQSNPSGVVDSSALKIKLLEYKFKLKEAGLYEKRAQNEFEKINFYKKEARKLLDSARVIEKKSELDPADSRLFLSQFNTLYSIAAGNSKIADSISNVAAAYRDTANSMNLMAEEFYLKVIGEFLQKNDEQNKSKNTVTAQQNSINSPVYTVQLGSGNLDSLYFKKAVGVQKVTCSDLVTRYIIGRFKTKEDALAYKQKMVDIGFKDAFIRTTDSMKY